MRKFILIAALSAMCADAAPFVTPSMMKRNGLTDEQYELLWSQGKNPKIDVAAAREWIFRASRYQNVTNWMETLGRTNDFARLSYTMQQWNFNLVETNRVLAVTNAYWRTMSERYRQNAEDWFGQWQEQTNRVAAVERILAAKEALVASEVARLKEEKADIEEKIASSTYILLRPWLRIKLAAVEAAIAKLEDNDE